VLIYGTHPGAHCADYPTLDHSRGMVVDFSRGATPPYHRRPGHEWFVARRCVLCAAPGSVDETDDTYAAGTGRPGRQGIIDTHLFKQAGVKSEVSLTTSSGAPTITRRRSTSDGFDHGGIRTKGAVGADDDKKKLP